MDKTKYLALIDPAVELVIRKHQDYNRATIKVHDYFPFGHKSYVQMIHVKATRLRSLMEHDAAAANFETIEDTLYDLLNYIVFYLERLEATKKLEAQNAGTKS